MFQMKTRTLLKVPIILRGTSYSTFVNIKSQEEDKHIYKEVFPWNGNKELVRHLVNKEVLYNNGGVIAINKPYGLANRQHPKSTSNNTQTLNTSLCSSYTGNLSTLLLLLAKELGFDKLQIAKSPERYNSGVQLLCSESHTRERIKKCYLRVAATKMLCDQYLVVTVSKPNADYFSGVVGFTLSKNESGSNKQAIIVPLSSVTKGQMKKDISKKVAVEHEVLSTNADLNVSLVRISSSLKTWHFLRVYLASLLSPVLGDNVHGSRVAFKGDQAKPVNPMSHLAQLPQKLTPSLLRALNLTRGQETIIPVHIHLSQLTVPEFLNKSENLIIKAPVPHSFQWTCQQLNLEIPS